MRTAQLTVRRDHAREDQVIDLVAWAETYVAVAERVLAARDATEAAAVPDIQPAPRTPLKRAS